MISIVLWAIILLAALFAFTTLATRDQSQVASLAGYTPMVVETDSMAPTFLSGDLIFIKKCDTAELKEGDIVCFHTIINNEYALNTHRIEEIDTSNGVRSYKTKGDNNAISDAHIIADGDIVGKYIGKINRLGTVMDFLSSSMGFLVVIVLPMLLFFIYQVYHLVMVTINLKKAMAVEEAERKELAREEVGRTDPERHPGQMEPRQQAEEDGRMEPERRPERTEPQSPADEGRRAEPERGPEPMEPGSPKAAPEPAAEQRPAVDAETEEILAEARKIRAEAEAAKARAEAEVALAEAKRMKAEAEAELAKVRAAKENEDKPV